MAKVAKRKAGQPTKYKEEYCELLISHLSQGFSFVSFGGVVGVCEDTLHEWKKRHPKFSESQRIGLTSGCLFWEKIGLHGTVGKIPGFNTTAWIFNMKNRFNWRDKQDIEHSGEKQKISIKIEKDDEGL